jgi:hypothetical protein
LNYLQRLANEPTKRWAEFKLGLGIFVLGVMAILAGAKYWIWLQIPGLLLLVIGSVIAGKGYLGILIFRLSYSFKGTKPPASLFDKDK